MIKHSPYCGCGFMNFSPQRNGWDFYCTVPLRQDGRGYCPKCGKPTTIDGTGIMGPVPNGCDCDPPADLNKLRVTVRGEGTYCAGCGAYCDTDNQGQPQVRRREVAP